MESLGFRVRLTGVLVPIVVGTSHLLVHIKAEMELTILSFTPLATRVKESELTGQRVPSSFSTPFAFCWQLHQ